MSKYSLDPITDNCYPGTAVLINKLDIRDDDILLKAEIELTHEAAAAWELTPQLETFDFKHYKAIHKHLFQDIYDWAGKVRDVDISKKGTRFCPYDKIDDQAGRIFARLQKLNYLQGMAKGKFVAEFVDLYMTTNYLHPFREGNGRTQRLFLAQLARNANYKLDFADIDIDELMITTIQSAQGVKDGLLRIFTREIDKLKPSIIDSLENAKKLVAQEKSTKKLPKDKSKDIGR